MRKNIIPIILSGLWISVSEFFRNEILLKNFWIDYYDQIDLTFQTLPINGILWVVWSFIFAFIIHRLFSKFGCVETVIYSWIAGFVLMWIVMFNLQVLPLKLLIFAIPLSFIEVRVSVLIYQFLNK